MMSKSKNKEVFIPFIIFDQIWWNLFKSAKFGRLLWCIHYDNDCHGGNCDDSNDDYGNDNCNEYFEIPTCTMLPAHKFF